MPAIPQVIPFVIGGGGTSVNLGQAASANAAFGHTSEKVKRTHYALPITVFTSLSATVGQAASAGTAQPITARKDATVGQATTVTTAQITGRARPIPVGRVESPNLAQHHSILALQGGRTHYALPITIELVFNPPTGQSSDTETAQVIRPTKRITVSQATTSSAASAASMSRAWGVGLATASDTSMVVSKRKTAVTGSTNTSDTATVAGHAKRKGAGQSAQAEIAIEIAPTRRVPVGQASTASTARVVTATLISAPPTETDTAVPIRVSKRVTVAAPPITVDTTHAVTPRRSYGVEVASESSVSQLVLARGFENVILSTATLLPARWRARVLPARWTADIT